MPIKKSFCDAWYTACYNDYFCGEGSYFGCAAYYDENFDSSSDDKENKALIAGLTVTGALAVVGIFFACLLVQREKSGKPMFVASNSATSS
jgi:hypothetical protein